MGCEKSSHHQKNPEYAPDWYFDDLSATRLLRSRSKTLKFCIHNIQWESLQICFLHFSTVPLYLSLHLSICLSLFLCRVIRHLQFPTPLRISILLPGYPIHLPIYPSIYLTLSVYLNKYAYINLEIPQH